MTVEQQTTDTGHSYGFGDGDSAGNGHSDYFADGRTKPNGTGWGETDDEFCGYWTAKGHGDGKGFATGA